MPPTSPLEIFKGTWYLELPTKYTGISTVRLAPLCIYYRRQPVYILANSNLCLDCQHHRFIFIGSNTRIAAIVEWNYFNFQHGVRLLGVCVCESAVKLCYYLVYLVIFLVFKWKVYALMPWFYYHGSGFTPAFSCRRGTCCLYMAPHFRSWLGKKYFVFHNCLIYW